MPVNVAVPAEAEKLPLTSKRTETEKPDAVEILPAACSELNTIVPAPLIVFNEPFIKTVPAPAEKEPDTTRLLLSVKEVFVVTVPVTVRSYSTIFKPLIDLAAPVIVINPPVKWVNCPAPEVVKFPETLSRVPAAAVIPGAVILRLLKL